MAHDEFNLCDEGDEVLIRHCRPLSNRKRFVCRRKLWQENTNHVQYGTTNPKGKRNSYIKKLCDLKRNENNQK
eukprot:jgi/Galph1/2464/GphlegSOOS_G1108.1